MRQGVDRSTGNRFDFLNRRDFAIAVALHLLLLLVLWVAGFKFSDDKTLIPIDMTIVPPWAEQTDDPQPDPNPPPPEVKETPPPPKAVEPPKADTPAVRAVEQVKEKPKPVNLKEKAKFVKTAVKPPEKLDLRQNAKKIEPPPTKTYGKATAADKPLSPEEFRRLMNQGYRIGARNQLAGSEEQRCISVIAQAIKREWAKESFKWYSGLQPLVVSLSLGPGGRVAGFRIVRGSGDASVDRTAQRALQRLGRIVGLSATFIEQNPTLEILMEPTQG
ncbi:MAG: TonB C-terminal domain-containing protein [Kiritimatiellia bacterium]